jgi:phosphoribosylformylglycinamidine (FGAM) synthase-like amidotransferase family enzyme
MKPIVNVLYLPGTNCHAETLRAFTHVGASPRLLFISDVLSEATRLDDADLLCIPGGFSFGDHIGAGTVAGLLLRTRLAEQFRACQDRPILGICNGFQVTVRAGCFGPDVALKVNGSGTFHNQPKQRHIVVSGNDSPWLTGLADEVLEFPCAHGQGRFVYRRAEPVSAWQPALRYPAGANPDGSMADVAGVTSTNGLVFGLMNHPERARDPDVRLAFFENGVRAAV